MKTWITSWDDGTYEDLRMAELLKKYKIPAIFYIPSNCQLTEEDILDLSKNFEIGGHTVNHFQDMKLLDDETVKHEIEDNKIWLEFLIGKKIKSFCYPRGRFDERVKLAVKNAGYKEARTTKVLNTKKPKDKFEIATSLHLSYPRKDYNGRDQWELARWFIDGYFSGNIKYCNFWGHSKELSKFSYWNQLEELFKYIYDKKNNKQEKI